MKRYFVAKSATLDALERSSRTSVWAVSDRKTPPQPRHVLADTLKSSEVILLFSVNNCHGWHGYANMVTEPGTVTDETTESRTLATDLSQKQLDLGVKSDLNKDVKWHRFQIKWRTLYLQEHGQQCLPFSQTSHLTIAQEQSLNMARNFDEVPAAAGEELCRLIDEHYTHLSQMKSLKEKERLENLPPVFFQPGAERDPHVIWSRLLHKVEKMGHVLLACAFGSQRYNTHTKSSDMDMFVVYAARTHQVLGLNPPQPTIKNQDRESCDYTIHEAHRYCELLASGDPRCVETLFLHPSSIYHQSPVWDQLKSHAKKFLTKECTEKYLRDALGGKGLKQLDKWLQTDGVGQDDPPSPWLGKLFYIILRLLQNARDVMTGDLIVYREDSSQDRQLLMSARQCSRSTAELYQEVHRLVSEVEVKKKERGDESSNAPAAAAEQWLLRLRYADLHQYMTSTGDENIPVSGAET